MLSPEKYGRLRYSVRCSLPVSGLTTRVDPTDEQERRPLDDVVPCPGLAGDVAGGQLHDPPGHAAVGGPQHDVAQATALQAHGDQGVGAVLRVEDDLRRGAAAGPLGAGEVRVGGAEGAQHVEALPDAVAQGLHEPGVVGVARTAADVRPACAVEGGEVARERRRVAELREEATVRPDDEGRRRGGGSGRRCGSGRRAGLEAGRSGGRGASAGGHACGGRGERHQQDDADRQRPAA